MTTCPAHLGRGRESPGIFTARLLCLVAHIVGPLGPSRSSRFFLTLLNSYAFYTYPAARTISPLNCLVAFLAASAKSSLLDA